MVMQHQPTSSTDKSESSSRQSLPPPPRSIFQSSPLHHNASPNQYSPPLQRAHPQQGLHQPPLYSHPPPVIPHNPSVPTTPSHHTPSTLGTLPLKSSQDHKRPRACESCRSLKVKCEPNDKASPSCRRCAKANRECIFTVPTRKRQKKADSKVAELESKIDALTARLNATKQGRPQPSDDEDEEDEDMEGASGSEHPSRSPDSVRPPYQFSRAPSSTSNSRGYQQQVRDHIQHFLPPGAKVAIPTGDEVLIPYIQYVDVIDQQLLSMDMATGLFNFFNERMAPHFPAIVFPPRTTAFEIRKTKPTLFLAILAAASSGTSHPDLRRALQKETQKAFAERIIMGSEKSLELVQALLIGSIYYYPPDVYEELSFYLIIHLAASMALDIGLGTKPKRSKAPLPQCGQHNSAHPLGKNCDMEETFNALSTKEKELPPGINNPGGPFTMNIPRPPQRSRPKNSFPDPCTIESRRTLLACFWACSNVSLALRRPNMLKYTSFMRDSVDMLETSSQAVASDKVLCQWVRLQVIAMELAQTFELDDPAADLSIADPRMQIAMRNFSRRLQDWRQSVDPSTINTSLQINYHLVTMYAHEIALHVDHNVDEFRPPFTEHLVREPILKPNALIEPYHIDAISACVTAAQALLETFCSFSVEDLACIPVITFVRCGYACMILIKVASTSAIPGSELGNVIRDEELRVDEYINRTLGTLAQAAKGDRNKTAGKFTMILIMLRSWYMKYIAELEARGRQRGDMQAKTPAEPPTTPGAHHRDAGQPQTPLQLLAEQATFQQPLHPQGFPEQQPFPGYQSSTDFDPMVIAGFVEFQAGDIALGFSGVGREAFTDDSFWSVMEPGPGWSALAGEGWGY